MEPSDLDNFHESQLPPAHKKNVESNEKDSVFHHVWYLCAAYDILYGWMCHIWLTQHENNQQAESYDLWCVKQGLKHCVSMITLIIDALIPNICSERCLGTLGICTMHPWSCDQDGNVTECSSLREEKGVCSVMDFRPSAAGFSSITWWNWVSDHVDGSGAWYLPKPGPSRGPFLISDAAFISHNSCFTLFLSSRSECLLGLIFLFPLLGWQEKKNTTGFLAVKRCKLKAELCPAHVAK